MASHLIDPGLAARSRSENVFLNVEGPRIANLFGGLTVQEDGTLKVPTHYKELEPTMQAFARQRFGLSPGANITKPEWGALFEELAKAEAAASQSDGGPYDIFNRMVVRIGEHSDEIDPWLNLIPDDYGLCIVKSAFALLLNRAREYSDKRQAIFDAFLKIRNTIGEATSRGIHFRNEPSVNRCAVDLYDAIVDAIQDLLLIVESQKTRRWPFISKKKNQLRDTETILKGVNDRANDLLVAVDNCRDAAIKKTGVDAQQTLEGVRFISWKAVEIKDSVSKLQTGQTALTSTVQEMEKLLVDTRDSTNQRLLEILRELRKKDQITITKLESLLRQELMGQHESRPTLPRHETSKALVSLKRLFQILSTRPSDRPLSQSTKPNVNVFDLRNSDLETVVSKGDFDARSQSQAHSILNQDEFQNWISSSDPAMLFVDGNIQAAALQNISPMSLFCANLSLTLGKMEPDSVVMHFYCGLHVDSRRDDWYGPDGMIRSLILQVLSILADTDSLNLGFLDRRSYVHRLERHDLGTLCDLLHDLLRQFDADTTIYCIIDGVSKYDTDYMSTFSMLKLAIQRMEDIVRDDGLKPRLKVLMTVPFRASRRLRDVINDQFYFALSSRVLHSRELSERSISSSLSRPSTKSISSTGLMQQEENLGWGGEDYDDD